METRQRILTSHQNAHFRSILLQYTSETFIMHMKTFSPFRHLNAKTNVMQIQCHLNTMTLERMFQSQSNHPHLIITFPNYTSTQSCRDAEHVYEMYNVKCKWLKLFLYWNLASMP